MAFDITKFKEVGGPGSQITGGQIYSLHSDADTLATMMVSAYASALSGKFNSGDVIILSGTDFSQVCRIVDTAGVITFVSSINLGIVQAISGAGAVDITSAVTEITTTSADAYTLADGAIGQMKVVVMAGDGGDGVLTPTTLSGAATKITFADPGDSVTLLFGTSGWAVIGQGGLGTGPVVAV